MQEANYKSTGRPKLWGVGHPQTVFLGSSGHSRHPRDCATDSVYLTIVTLSNHNWCFCTAVTRNEHENVNCQSVTFLWSTQYCKTIIHSFGRKRSLDDRSLE